MKLTMYAVRKIRTKRECVAAGGKYRKGVRGVRKASCAMAVKRSGHKRGGGKLARFVKRGTPCRPGEKKFLVKSRRNPRGTEACIRR